MGFKTLGIIDEDFTNYRLPAMLISASACDFRCSKELCHNSDLINSEPYEVPEEDILLRYRGNCLSKAIVIAGLEPMLQFDEVLSLVKCFRYGFVNDPFIIYTGYDKDEIVDEINILSTYTNIIVKFGRYIPGHTPHFDETLGVKLASNNQYAERIG